MVSLRTLELRDARDVFRAVDGSRDALRRWMAWYHDGYDLSDAESWIQHTVDAAATGTGFHFAMVDSTGELVGVISLEDVRPESGRAMLGYWMATPATGRGLGGQAVAQIVAWARERCNLLILWAVARTPTWPAVACSRETVFARPGRVIDMKGETCRSFMNSG